MPNVANLITEVFLAERIDSEMDDDNQTQGVFKVPTTTLFCLVLDKHRLH